MPYRRSVLRVSLLAVLLLLLPQSFAAADDAFLVRDLDTTAGEVGPSLNCNGPIFCPDVLFAGYPTPTAPAGSGSSTRTTSR